MLNCQNSSQKRILILDGHSSASLAVIRSLAARGFKVDVGGEEGAFNLSFYSRYPHSRLKYSSSGKSVKSFIEYFRELLASYNYDVIFPSTDRTILPLHYLGRDLPGFSRVAIPSFQEMETTLDKELTLKLAREEEIPVPLGMVWEEESELSREIKFPLVVKSRYSKYLSGDRLVSDPGPVFVGSREKLFEICQEKHLQIPRPLIQEVIYGEGYGYFVLARQGLILQDFAHRRLREEDPLGSRSSCCEAIEPPAELREYSSRLIKRLNWTGVAMVEFKRQSKTGKFYLMEINGRFWGSLPLAIHAGIDFPYLYLKMLSGYSFKQRSWKSGSRARHIYADIQHLIAALKGSPKGWQGDFPSRGQALKGFGGTFFQPGCKNYNLVFKDPVPGLMENGRFLLKEIPISLFRKVFR